MTEADRKPLPPYLPYKTFTSFLDQLRNVGMPSHIDKSVMTSMSGAMQSWLKSALRYMRLVDADDAPDPRLVKLVNSKGDDRKAALMTLFKSSYAFLDGKVDLSNTTPQKLRTTVVDLGASGETADKIMAFMIAFGKDAGMTLSPHLLKRAAPQRRPRQKPPTAAGHDHADADASGDEPSVAGSSAMKTLTLPKAGGTLTLSGNINLFSLTGDERALVFALIDLMNEFEVKHGGDV